MDGMFEDLEVLRRTARSEGNRISGVLKSSGVNFLLIPGIPDSMHNLYGFIAP
jgi:hypothetical protein